MFKADGAIGGTAQKVGGPFAKDGFVGLVFTFFDPLVPFRFPCLFHDFGYWFQRNDFDIWSLGVEREVPGTKWSRWLIAVVEVRKLRGITWLRGCWRTFLMFCEQKRGGDET